MNVVIRRSGFAALLGAIVVSATPVLAATDAERIADLERKAAAMAEEIAALRAERDEGEPSDASGTSDEIRAEVVAATQTAQRAEKAANEWKNTTTVAHISGYAAAGYTNQENGTDSFDLANFNPIFHFQYGDRILWESELEVEVGEDGETDVGLEYSAIDIFINDYLVLVAGKFLSPLGNFRQNLHPAWINKLASAPPGFGHDGAAPIADVGIQLRGGFNIADQRKVTYAAYVANGPKLIGEDGEIHAVDTEGFAACLVIADTRT